MRCLPCLVARLAWEPARQSVALTRCPRVSVRYPSDMVPVRRCSFQSSLTRAGPEAAASSDRAARDTAGGGARRRAVGGLLGKVRAGEECWAYDLQGLVATVRQDGMVTPEEAASLMRACARDVLDLLPSEQRSLTARAWAAVGSATCTGSRQPQMFANMLDAFTFQEMEADVAGMQEAMAEGGVEASHQVKVALLRHLCSLGRVEEARAVQGEGRGMAMSEDLAAIFLRAHAALGQEAAAEEVLRELNTRNIHWGARCYEALVLGSARAGDLDRLDFFLHRLKVPSDALVLAAIVEMAREHAGGLGLLLGLEPRCTEEYSKGCRRAVKALVEAGYAEAAWTVVSKTRVHKLNNTDKERVIRICPSVIVVNSLLATSTAVEAVLGKVEELVAVDPKIIGRTVALAIDLALRDGQKADFCKSLIAHIMASHPGEKEAITDLVGQTAKRLLKVAIQEETDEEVYRVFSMFSHLGLRMEGRGRSGSSRGWDLIMNKLLPTIPAEGSWSEASLKARCWEVRDGLVAASQGLYSNSVTWGSVLQHLLNRENATFFRVAAALTRELGTPYAPRRWVLSLANCLVKLEDVKSFVDILEVAHINSHKRGDTDDLEVVTEALLHFVTRGQRMRGASTQQPRAHVVLVDVLEEVWVRKVRLPGRQVERVAMALQGQGAGGLAQAVRGVPVVQELSRRSRTSR